MTQLIFNWVSVYRVNFFRIAQQNATWCKCKSSTRYALIWSNETARKWDSELRDSISGNLCAFSTKFTVDQAISFGSGSLKLFFAEHILWKNGDNFHWREWYCTLGKIQEKNTIFLGHLVALVAVFSSLLYLA